MSKEHFVQNNTQGPNISLVRVNLAFEDFRGHINRRPKHSLGHLIGRSQVLTKPKVSQLNDAVMEKYVIRLKVPVQNIVLVKHLKRF